ncbi:MAG TPA: hypothetical protein VJC39_01035 [Candidatus Nanoarchaeia archaeon]|nr:hypothetical protein [Candidatus Nanoarchaeia archaeon]
MLVNIVHPHMYHVQKRPNKNGGLEEGELELSLELKEQLQFAERNSKINFFINKALSLGAQVIWYQDSKQRIMEIFFLMELYSTDPNWNILMDSRIDIAVTIPGAGAPLPDVKPKNYPLDSWNRLREICISHSELGQKISSPKISFYIGGALERCVTSMAIYQAKFFREKGQKIYCVPELCASFKDDEVLTSRIKLAEYAVEEVTYDKALQLLSARK